MLTGRRCRASFPDDAVETMTANEHVDVEDDQEVRTQ
jgi:hypothetical protein